MIDELYKDRMDTGWDRVGRWVARSGLTPNAVTWLGMALCAGNALAFCFHRNFWLFGLLVGLIELLDNVDGAVARVTGLSSRRGAYLDATTDRYKDSLILLAIAYVTGFWLPATLAITGSLITSYAAARASTLGAHGDASGGLPDLFERLERTATLCLGLVAAPFCPPILGHALMWWVLYFVAAMTHITGFQRIARRLGELDVLDAGDASATASEDSGQKP
ncbi:MAG: CDP-alcohol phosphatidyltransferase family protein [Myxococcota bacterium]|jgi:phosphatidylglycerophosphate synthase|nr:CDP-alcohol phosphatidyltransferase family protein [Myxococcota bacterium]